MKSYLSEASDRWLTLIGETRVQEVQLYSYAELRMSRPSGFVAPKLYY